MWIAIGALTAGLAVAAGAFAAHGLKGSLDPAMLDAFEVGARYQMYHSLGLIAIGLLTARERSRRLRAAAIAMLLGMLLFCGSLYALALSGVRALGAITPLGGLSFLVGWGLLAMHAWSTRDRSG